MKPSALSAYLSSENFAVGEGDVSQSEQVHRPSLSDESSKEEVFEIPAPQIIHPVLVEPPPSHIQPEVSPDKHSSGSVEDEEEWTKTPHMLVENFASIACHSASDPFETLLVQPTHFPGSPGHRGLAT